MAKEQRRPMPYWRSKTVRLEGLGQNLLLLLEEEQQQGKSKGVFSGLYYTAPAALWTRAWLDRLVHWWQLGFD